MTNRPEVDTGTITDTWLKASLEIEAMKVVKHLPDNQQRAVRWLVENLIRIEELFPEPRQMIKEEARAVLRSAMMGLKESLEAGVPREVLLAVLDRHFLEPIPADPGATGKMAGG